MATQREKDYAIKMLGEIKTPLIARFMGVDINEFSKDELIKILSIQNKQWLESRGFQFNS
jgi:predicted XRE-type DNA-binding protein